MRFGILGPLLVVDDAGRELALGGLRQRAVLAVLLMHAGEALSSDRLIDELWGERPPATATKTLQVYVSNLRKALDEGVLLTRAGGYVLETGENGLDVARFEVLAGEGRRALAAGRPDVAVARLREALELWRGPPLADFAYEAFAQGERARLEETRLAALEDRIDAELALGEHARLVGELDALVREHPMRERFSAQLMLALYRSGRQAEALEAYQRVRAHLAEEQGLEPGPDLRTLQQQILDQAPTLDPSPSVKGLTPSRGAGTSSALPRPLTPLIGRAREIETICGLLTSPDLRLVTLNGAGGVGKTRLAVAVAWTLLDQFPGGTFMVRLAGVSDSASILPMVAEQIGIIGHGDLPLLDVLAHRFAHEPALVVLDNFEQLVAGSAVLAELLSYAAELRVLVTSQVPLRITPERVIDVGPLGTDDAFALFVDRARSVTPDFAAEDDDRGAVESICARLDCMPLAIELAAARIRVLGTRSLEQRLERPLELLTGGERDLPERQRSLRATIGWTHGLLDPGQQGLLSRLAVCVGPVPLSLIEAVAQTDATPAETLDRLEGLLEFSFVRRREAPDVGVRFAVPQALRDFALERLAATGDEDEVRLRHAEHIERVAHAARLWKWGATIEQRLGLRAVRDEIRPAVAWARDHDPELHVRLCAALAAYWVYGGVLSEVAEELRQGRDSGVGGAADRALILSVLAKCAQLEGAGSDPCELADAAVAEWREVDDEYERALGLPYVGWVLTWAGRHDDAIALDEESLATLRTQGDRRLILRGLVFLSHVLADDGQIDRVEALLSEADELAQGDPVWELAAIHGDCAYLRGDYARALEIYADSLRWTSTTDESHQMLMDLRCIGESLVHHGDPETALVVFELVRLEEERTGRSGDLPMLVEWFGEARRTARESVSPEAAEGAIARARRVRVPDRAAHAIALAQRAAAV